MSLQAIQDGLEAVIDDITTLQIPENDAVKCPAAIVLPQNRSARETLPNSGGLRPLDFEIVVLAAGFQQGPLRHRATLNAYLEETGDSSIEAKLEAAKTLGGAATTLEYRGWRDYGLQEWNGTPYLGAVIDVRVWP